MRNPELEDGMRDACVDELEVRQVSDRYQLASMVPGMVLRQVGAGREGLERRTLSP